MTKLRFLLGILCATFAFSTTGRAAVPVPPDYVKLGWIKYNDEFLVRWLPVPNATGYNVYRYDTNTAAWAQVATNLNVPAWNVLSFREPSGADPGPAMYAVSALNADGEGPITGASVVPGPGLEGTFVVNDEWWPKGYTFVDPGFIYDLIDQGTDGMVELGLNATNFTHAAWHTNIDWGHRLHVTNLSPGTVWTTRLTMVDSNGIGISMLYPYWGTYTLPQTPIDVWEDTENTISIGHFTWTGPGQLYTPALHGAVIPGSHWYDWKYTPQPNFTGTDTFQILDNPDGPPVTITLNVQNINDPPVAHDFTVYVPEDTQSVFTPPVTDIDGSFWVSMVYSPPLYGWASGWLGSDLMYDPPLNFVGTDEFTYIAADYEWSLPARVTVIVTNVNDAPTSVYQSFTALEDTPLTFTLAATDVDGDALSVIITMPPWTGTITNTGMTVTYTPAPDFNGLVWFEFRVSDGQTTSDLAFADINVEPVNDQPVADDKSAVVDEDGAVFIDLSGADVDYDQLTFQVVTPPQHGQFINGYYMPAANYFGPDSFTYKANDGQSDSPPATVNVTVLSANDGPPAPDYVDVAWLDNVDQFLVRWFPVAGATSYNVYRYDTNTSTWTAVATNLSFDPWNVLSFRESGSQDAGPTTYSVTAVNAEGESAPTSASVTPGHGWSTFSCQSDYWQRGYTFIETDCWGDNPPGTMGMLEVSTDGTNFTHGVWSTNIATHQVHRVTNLLSGTRYYTRLTQIDTNGSGFSEVFPSGGVVTLPLAPIDVLEDQANEIEIGDTYWHEHAQILVPPAHGTLVPVEWMPSRWIYTPETNFYGVDTVVILDNPSGPPVTITLNVQNVDDPPVAQPFTVYTAEDTPVTITPIVFDLESDPHGVWVQFGPANGYAYPDNGTNLIYTPNPDFVGTDQFEFFAYGPNFNWMGTVLGTIIVTNVNDAPVTSDQSINTVEDTPVTFGLTATDVDGDALTIEILDQPLNGSVTNTGMSVTYTPAANYAGSDTFTYRAFDGALHSATATVAITISAVNDPPVANNQSVSTSEDQSLAITLTGVDVEGSPLTFTVVTAPQHGQFVGGVYTPAANYNGPDSFTFKANDGQIDSAPATVNITVNAVNDAPVADSKSAVVNEDGSVTIALTGSDVEGSALTFTMVSAPAHGTFVNGTYTPAANHNGADNFTYKANDGQLDSALATVSIAVNPVNDAPVANAQSVSTPYNTAVNITLTGSDVEGSALTFTTLSSPANGTLSGTGANRTFTPNIGWSGTTSFTFKVNDGALDSATATVTITVAAATGIPSAPSGLTATAVSQTQINLAWTDNSNNEDGFKIERSPNGNSGWTQIATVGPNVTTFSNTGLTKNTRYYYRVRAYNVLGNSAYSNTANARTQN